MRSRVRLVSVALVLTFLLAACGGTQPQASEPKVDATAANTVSAIAPTSAAVPTNATATKSDLVGIKTYLLEKATTLKNNTAALKDASERYYALAQKSQFQYEPLWANDQTDVRTALNDARKAWIAASPGYEQIEGIVAGVPSLSEYDVILDAGSSAAEDPENAVPFDLKLPDGRVLEKPGNLFGLLEGTMWGTRKEFVALPGADLDGDGTVAFGEVLPDANMLKGAADEMDRYTGDLLAAAQQWQPNESDAFTALVVMVPTMSEYFESWKQSRFVAGTSSTQTDFVVISRLADIQDILSGLEVVYGSVSPMVADANTAQNQQTSAGLKDLKSFVADIFAQEKGGKKFTAEEADTLGSEAQERADAIAGQISQIAAQLNIQIKQ